MGKREKTYMKKWLALSLLLIATVAFGAKDPSKDNKISIRDSDSNGRPTFVTGELGKLGAGAADKAAKDFVKTQKDLLDLNGTEDFDTLSVQKDALGQTHVKLQEKIKGLPVFGGDFIVHSDANGNVFAINGRLGKDHDKLPRHPSVDAMTALDTAAGEAGIASFRIVSSPELMYAVNEKGNLYLAWMARIEYRSAEGPELDKILINAEDGHLLFTSAEYQRLKSRQTYSANNGTALPGTLRIS